MKHGKAELKVALIHNVISPYRHPLFEKLSEKVDLKVYYCSDWLHPCKWDLWPRKYCYQFKVLSRMSIKTPIGEFSLNPSIMKELLKNRPHVLIITSYTDPTTWLAFVMGRLLSIPIIHWTEGTKEPNSFLGLLTKPLRIFFVKKPDAIVVPGRMSKDYYISLGVEAERVFIAPNAIDNELFVNISDKCTIGKDQLKEKLDFCGKILILYVGQLIERKGLKYLLQAYSKIEKERDDVALLVLGRGPQESDLRNIADLLGIRRFKIMRPGLRLEELIALYSAADIFILPTLEDVWGFVINEAMVCRLPIIATQAAQAAQEMIRSGENGYLIKAACSEELYCAIKSLIYNPELRKQMGKKSNEIIRHEFDVSLMVQGFLSSIEYCTMDMPKCFQQKDIE